MAFAVGEFGRLHPTPAYGWNVGALDFLPVSVDATGALNIVGSGPGGLTDAQLRATPVPVSGPLTDAQLRATAVAVSNTDLTTLASIVSATRAAVNLIVGQVGVQGGTGIRTASTLRVTVATDDVVPISGSIGNTAFAVTKTDLTPSAPTTTSVGVASAQAVAAAATRKGLVLRNLSSNRISLGFGNTAVLDSGVTLYPRDTFAMDDYDFDLGAVNAIASAAASPLSVQEYLT